MIDKIIEGMLEFVTKKEIYGTIITLALNYFLYQTICIILESRIDKSKNDFEKKKRKTIVSLSENILKYLFIIITTVSLLGLYGVNIASMLAGLGITATILGLSLQDTLKDIINGISIMMENYFIVGDIVRYNNFTGEVIEFGLKSTKIKNHAGETLMISNRNIYEIVNISQNNQNVQIEFGIAYEEDVDKVEKIINSSILPKINKIPSVKDDSALFLGVNALDDSCVKYLIQYHCNRDSQWRTKREALRIIKKELDKNRIKIPYPQLEVHNETKIRTKR